MEGSLGGTMIERTVAAAIASAVAVIPVPVIPVPVIAQVLPDTTLPSPSQAISGDGTWRIDGGTAVGGNLFHSFLEFSIPEGQTLRFNNSPAIDTILTRVTGGSISNIEGTLAANGDANLVLLNPNGIRFGGNTRLNLGGGFLATTGVGIRLADGTVFSAVEPQGLTLSVPIGVQMGTAAAGIQVGAGAEGPTLNAAPGQPLALVGGDISIEGSRITALEGDIALASVTAGEVGLNLAIPQLQLTFNGVSWGDLSLAGTEVSIFSQGGRSLQLHGGRLRLGQGSQLSLLNLGSEPDGRILLNAATELQISERSAAGQPSQVLAVALAEGAGADIEIYTGRLQLPGGGNVLAGTVGAGDGGNITVQARQALTMTGVGFDGLQPFVSLAFQPGGSDFVSVLDNLQTIDSAIATGTFGAGDGGTLVIDTPRVDMANGAVLVSTTIGNGNGGELAIRNATEVNLTDAAIATGAFNVGDVGDSGNLSIASQRLRLWDSSFLLTATLGTGDGGDITIDAPDFVETGVSDRTIFPSPVISSSSLFGSGQGGDIRIRTGRARFDLGLISSESGGNPGNELLPLDAFIDDPNQVVLTGGPAGNIFLDVADTLDLIGNGPSPGGFSYILASSLSDQPAGTITINARQIRITDEARIIADSRSQGDTGGTIDINSDLLLLRRGDINSNLVGSRGNRAGLININTDTLVAVDDSDITAAAFFQGRGGSIVVNADLILGTEFRDRITPDSDITAISTVDPQLNGTVIVNAPTPNLQAESSRLPELVNQEDLIARGCATAAQNQFVITGRGGLPESPQQSLERAAWQDLRLPEETAAAAASPPPAQSPPSQWVEASGWTTDAEGNIRFIATAEAAPAAAVCGEDL